MYFGPKHKYTLWSTGSVADTLLAMGEKDEALKLRRREVKVRPLAVAGQGWGQSIAWLSCLKNVAEFYGLLMFIVDITNINELVQGVFVYQLRTGESCKIVVVKLAWNSG